jgi:7-cyano-7-deazaguanine reductase
MGGKAKACPPDGRQGFMTTKQHIEVLMTDYSKAAQAKVEIPEGVKLFTFPAKKHTPIIEWEYPEFQSLCPISERHDQGVVKIRYKPKKKILEGKSVRDYLMLWRNKKNWQEYITEEIAGFLYKVCEPDWLTVTINWAPRGGILATTTSRKGNPPSAA